MFYYDCFFIPNTWKEDIIYNGFEILVCLYIQ